MTTLWQWHRLSWHFGFKSRSIFYMYVCAIKFSLNLFVGVMALVVYIMMTFSGTSRRLNTVYSESVQRWNSFMNKCISNLTLQALSDPKYECQLKFFKTICVYEDAEEKLQK